MYTVLANQPTKIMLTIKITQKKPIGPTASFFSKWAVWPILSVLSVWIDPLFLSSLEINKTLFIISKTIDNYL